MQFALNACCEKGSSINAMGEKVAHCSCIVQIPKGIVSLSSEHNAFFSKHSLKKACSSKTVNHRDGPVVNVIHPGSNPKRQNFHPKLLCKNHCLKRNPEQDLFSHIGFTLRHCFSLKVKVTAI